MIVLGAKLTGLAVFIFLLAWVVEALTASPLSHQAFRDGMGIAYLCALLCLAVFTIMGDPFVDDVIKAALLCACASTLWAISSLDGYGFAWLCGISGVWYATLVRRIL